MGRAVSELVETSIQYRGRCVPGTGGQAGMRGLPKSVPVPWRGIECLYTRFVSPSRPVYERRHPRAVAGAELIDSKEKLGKREWVSACLTSIDTKHRTPGAGSCRARRRSPAKLGRCRQRQETHMLVRRGVAGLSAWSAWHWRACRLRHSAGAGFGCGFAFKSDPDGRPDGAIQRDGDLRQCGPCFDAEHHRRSDLEFQHAVRGNRQRLRSCDGCRCGHNHDHRQRSGICRSCYLQRDSLRDLFRRRRSRREHRLHLDHSQLPDRFCSNVKPASSSPSEPRPQAPP
jgi:hypothetical protein